MRTDIVRGVWRNAARHPVSSAINLTGLAASFATALLIYAFVSYETGYDKFLPGAENIYRLEVDIHLPSDPSNPTSMSPGPARDSFVQAFPEIQRATHFFYSRESVLKDNMLFGEIATQADANFFDVFKLEFIEGSAASAITDSSSVAISGTELQGYLSGWLMSALCHKQILKMARKYRGTVSQKGIYP